MNTTELVVFGVGQLGRLFAGGALRLGLRVTPVTRRTDRMALWDQLPEGTPIVIAVREADLASAIADIPPSRRVGQLILVQNALFAPLWMQYGAQAPTTVVLWTNVKPRVPMLVGRSTGLYGPHASLMAAIHEELGLPAQVLDTSEARDVELVAKYAFILTINALGLIEDTTVGAWLHQDRPRVERVLNDAIRLGEHYAGRPCSLAHAKEAAFAGMEGMGELKARGRSAATRLKQALSDASTAELAVDALKAIHTEASPL
ncbi:MAG: hypothetical protein AAFS10_17590 [Myxococcota bacterium]